MFIFNWDSEFFKIFTWLRKSKNVVKSNKLFSDDFDELVRWLDNENEFLWDTFKWKLNRKLSKLWMRLIIRWALIKIKKFWIIYTNSFFVNCLKYVMNAVKLTNTDSVNWWRSKITWFRVEWSINQSVENKNVNLMFINFFKFKEIAF